MKRNIATFERRIRPICFTAVAALALVLPAFAFGEEQADLARGEEMWAKCKACHTYAKDGRHIVGPRLFGMFGRRAGALADYRYSETMKNSTVVWDDATLDKFLEATQDYMPGSKMYGGLTNPEDRLSLIAWLKKVTRE